ncbi:MAG: hypothetical protein HN341_14820 [Verrucomicrobia bacterium]|nr:hypothetical protein [Verrucomicrobiota bacterium]
MHFKQYGRTFQLRIETADDLEAVLKLDESLWVATSAPTDVFRCDSGFLSLLDPDGSKRIHTGEMKQAIRWLLTVLADRSQLIKRTNHVPLAAINTETPEGAEVAKSAAYVLKTLGQDDEEAISLKSVRQFLSNLKEQPLNGDGVLVPAAIDNPETAQLIRDVISTVGGEIDASGEMGISGENLKRFREHVEACLVWRAQGRLPEDSDAVAVRPFGDATDNMHAIRTKHAALVDHFFSLCRAVRFDPRTSERVRCPEATLDALDLSQPDDVTACLTRSPLAPPNGDDSLPLVTEALNPLYASWVAALKTDVLMPILGEIGETLHVDQWQQVKQALKPFADYMESQKGALVQSLSDEQLQHYHGSDAYSAVEALIAADRSVSDLLKGIHEVERLVLYHQNLMRLANNFVSFSELYHPPIRALFEEGSVLLDGRWFDLALRVNDVAKHSQIAKSSNIFTLYLEVNRKAPDTKFTIAVPATAGSKGNLGVGKRGVFFDWRGQEHDAVVIRIIDNPISLREALVAPFTRLWAFILGKIEAMSGTMEKQLQKSTDALMKKPATTTAAPPAGVAGGPAGMMVGLSLSAAAIGSAFAFITKTLSGLSKGQLVAGVLGAAAVVAVPVSLIAILKLRRQDLSSLLEGCGWAINARMRFDNMQRRSFTRRELYPLNATGTPQRTWVKQLLVALAVVFVVWGMRAGCRGCSRDEAVVTAGVCASETNAVTTVHADVP